MTVLPVPEERWSGFFKTRGDPSGFRPQEASGEVFETAFLVAPGGVQRDFLAVGPVCQRILPPKAGVANGGCRSIIGEWERPAR